MSEPGTGFTVSRVAWLLLPALALPVGWWVGNLPTPEPAAPNATTAAAPATPSAPAPSAYPPVSSRAPEVRMMEMTTTEPPPPAVERTPEAETHESSSWTTMDGALEESRRNGKPVFIDFSADWCGPCQRLKHEVFEDGARAATLQGAVIPVSIVDQRRETGANPPEIEDLQQRYHVEAFPTLVVFSPATGRMVTTRGFRGADATLAWITEAAKSVR
jgi:thiol-disulfide isomerase/thioredoxin